MNRKINRIQDHNKLLLTEHCCTKKENIYHGLFFDAGQRIS